MSDDVLLNGAPIPLEISGKKFRATSLTRKDNSELNAYVQKELINLGRSALSPDMTMGERQELLNATLSMAVGVKWATYEGAKVMSTEEGTCRLAWQMIKKEHPKVSFEEFEKLFSENGDDRLEENVDETDIVFRRLNPEYFEEYPDDNDEDDSGASSDKPKSD